MAPTPENRYHDPGWRPVIGLGLLLALVPMGGRFALRRGVLHGSPLLLLRRLFAQFVVSSVLVGVVALFVRVGNSSPTVALVAAGLVVASGLGSVAGVAWARRVPADCASPDSLLGWYRARLFLQLAFSQVPALVGFAATLATGRPWLYAVGFVFAGTGLARAAPTARSLARDDERLHLAGCPHELRRLLTEG